MGIENGTESQTNGQGRIKSNSQIEYWKRFVLIAVLYSILIVISSTFLRIPILIPTPWITGVLFLYLAPIFLYSFSAMVRPWLVLAICIPSLCLGELLWCIVYGCAGELLVYVIISLNTYGVGCVLISLLRNRNEIIAMLIGGLWSFPGLLVPTYVYYSLILSWNPLYMVAIAILMMFLNLVIVPVSFTLNYALRKVLKTRHLDELYPKDTTSMK